MVLYGRNSIFDILSNSKIDIHKLVIDAIFSKEKYGTEENDKWIKKLKSENDSDDSDKSSWIKKFKSFIK